MSLGYVLLRCTTLVVIRWSWRCMSCNGSLLPSQVCVVSKRVVVFAWPLFFFLCQMELHPTGMTKAFEIFLLLFRLVCQKNTLCVRQKRKARTMCMGSGGWQKEFPTGKRPVACVYRFRRIWMLPKRRFFFSLVTFERLSSADVLVRVEVRNLETQRIPLPQHVEMLTMFWNPCLGITLVNMNMNMKIK